MRKTYLEKLYEKLNSDWIFYGPDEKSVKVENKFITKLYDDFIEDDFINIISDFYSIAPINTLDKDFEEKQILLKTNTDNHSNLLMLKLFLRVELQKCLYIFKEKTNINQYANYRYINNIIKYFYENGLSDKFLKSNYLYNKDKFLIWDYIFYNLYNKDNKDNNSINIILSLTILFKSINKNRNDFTYINFIKKLNNTKIITILKNGIKIIDEAIESLEKQIFEISSEKIIKFSNNFQNIHEFSSIFNDAVEENNLQQYVSKKINCYASMKVNDKIYMTFNGIKDRNIEEKSNSYKIYTTLKELIKNELEYVPISDNTRYFTFGNEFITYKQFSCSSMNKYNRMFTCCERKLIAKFLELNKNLCENEVKLLISKYPCILCQREINFINNSNEGIKINISHPHSLEDSLLKKFDTCAEKIINEKKLSE